MGYRRKTIDRDLLVDTANKILTSPVSTKDGRVAAIKISIISCIFR